MKAYQDRQGTLKITEVVSDEQMKFVSEDSKIIEIEGSEYPNEYGHPVDEDGNSIFVTKDEIYKNSANGKVILDESKYSKLRNLFNETCK